MFSQLDKAIETMLLDAPALTAPELNGASIDFRAPAKGNSFANETINVFLLEVKENRMLHDPEPIYEWNAGVYTRKAPPMRVDVIYVVTAWSNDPDPIPTEHKLLAQALGWLNHYPVIPAALVPSQPFPVVVFTALPDERLSIGEFWSALGIPPRAAFTLTATVALDYNPVIPVGPPVTTAITGYLQDEDLASREEQVMIGGLVRDSAGKPVSGAWVIIEPLGLTQFTNEKGQFLFTGVQRGIGYTLRARKAGFVNEAKLENFEIPSLNGRYDLKF